MKIGDKVQCWSDSKSQYLGWGKIIQIGISIMDLKTKIPFIQLESGKKIWGSRVYWISEKKAIEIGVRLFRDIYERSK